MDNTAKSYVYAGIAVFFWATVPTAFKICLGELEILPMLTIASVTSAVVLAAVVVLTGKSHLIAKTTRKDIFNSAFLGLINPALYYVILLRAYQLLPAQVAQPLNMIWPIILVFLSVPILGQQISAKSYIALLISFAGVYIISSQGNLSNPGKSDIRGILLAMGSSVFWAFYFILNVKDKRDEAVKLLLNFIFGSVYLVTAVLVTGSWPHSPGLKGTGSAIYIGIFEMGITFFFWLKALQLSPSTDRISNLVYLAPFLSLFFVHFFIHEPIYLTTLAGLLLIVSGIIIQNRHPRKV